MHLLQKLCHGNLAIWLTKLKYLVQLGTTVAMNDHLHAFISANGTVVVTV
jgi:hypothetical protein